MRFEEASRMGKGSAAAPDTGQKEDAAAARYRRVRCFTESLCEPLAAEDCVVQSMPDASPVKWHLAHTAWFFETFILIPTLPDYRPFHPSYGYLFNSYYNAVGERHSRPHRGLLSRPTVEDVFRYRAHVDRHMLELLSRDREGANPVLQSRDRVPLEGRVMGADLTPLLELGLHHEQQHQELILTDIKHLFSCNPLKPAYREETANPPASRVPGRQTGDGRSRLTDRAARRSMGWVSYAEGLHWIGHDGPGFAFDNETPRHRVFVEPFQLADRLVTSEEYRAFIEDDGYRRPELWLSDGWSAVQAHGWNAPLYWEQRDGRWWLLTLAGMREVDGAEPVCHVSYYEADAYARWAGARLPGEAEWEIAAAAAPIEGTFAEDGPLHPMPVKPGTPSGTPDQLFGDVWEWTSSAYSPYPRFRPLEGALGEYNGKFMCNQMVLRGGSCATSRSHIRPSYRNFFPPEARWQFTGLRLARGG